MIHLIGPGGAGKTTTGATLADRLGVPFVDLDAEFAASLGDISAYLDAHGYDAYAEQNVSLYSALTSVAEPFRVIALSSGFMTYRRDVHPRYPRCTNESHRAHCRSCFFRLSTLRHAWLKRCVAGSRDGSPDRQNVRNT